MFDLEQSIAEWRRQMLAAGIKTPVPLEELETHLREEIERQDRIRLERNGSFQGCNATKSGQRRLLKSEFRKVEAHQRRSPVANCANHVCGFHRLGSDIVRLCWIFQTRCLFGNDSRPALWRRFWGRWPRFYCSPGAGD